jgi:hypothetical protein
VRQQQKPCATSWMCCSTAWRRSARPRLQWRFVYASKAVLAGGVDIGEQGARCHSRRVATLKKEFRTALAAADAGLKSADTECAALRASQSQRASEALALTQRLAAAEAAAALLRESQASLKALLDEEQRKRVNAESVTKEMNRTLHS